VVADDFHARFSALGKTYVYRVVNGPVMSPFWLRYAHQESRTLDLEAMRQSAEVLHGTHDWTAFSSAQADAESKVRTVSKVEVMERYDKRGQTNLIEIEASANGFLRYMVRSIAGTLLAVGRGELDSEAIKEALSSGDRSLVGSTAPACGLTLLSVKY
jgi:tRNA pseudouridine38-40 synthase